MIGILLVVFIFVQFLANFIIDENCFLCCCCSDNSKLCSCGGDRQIFYWDVATGRVIRKFRGHDSEVEYFLVLPYITNRLL